MMSENSEFVWIDPKNGSVSPFANYQEYLEHGGKWLIYGKKEFIEGLGSKMLDLVGKSNILEAKFTKKPALKVPEGYELGRNHALIVYCDDRKNRSVKRKLEKELGVNKMFWKYDRDTIRESIEKQSA